MENLGSKMCHGDKAGRVGERHAVLLLLSGRLEAGKGGKLRQDRPTTRVE